MMKISFLNIIFVLFKVYEFYQYWKLLMSDSLVLLSRIKKKKTTMYTFRPYELVKVNYKSYKSFFNNGINKYPRPRSGHRIVCNDSDLYCFGGFNPNVPNNSTGRTLYLFQELWRFDLFTKKWSLVYSPTDEGMPDELASNAVILKNNMLIVCHGHLPSER